MSKPIDLVVLDDAVRHLRDTLRKDKATFPPSLAGMCCGLIAHWGRMRRSKQHTIHPGVAKMASWGGCSERQAQRNMRMLEAWGFVSVAGNEGGGRHARRYTLDTEVLCRVMIDLGLNPHPTLLDKLRDPAVRGDMRGDMRGDAMSPGSYRDTAGVSRPSESTSQGGDARVIPFPGLHSNREAS